MIPRAIRFRIFLFISILSGPFLVTAEAALRVDLNPDTDRKDVLSSNRENWRVPEGPTATQKFGDITITLRAVGSVGSGLATSWWKGGYDTGATLASDGVLVKDGDRGGQIEMVISGLTPGRHSIATFHNALSDAVVSRFSVSVDGQIKLKAQQPSKRVTNDDDALSAFIEVDAQAGKDIVIGFKPDGSGKVNNIVLNGFEIDTGDPARRSAKPLPETDDEHAPADPVLTWQAAKSAGSHYVYLGTSQAAVENATPSSPEFKGEVKVNRFTASGLNQSDTYFWRVDEVSKTPADKPVKGDVWRFRVQHIAFPGAEGYGRFARGGRGGRVIEVTNLEDSGPGSLREAVDAEGPRTVVFRVGGTIALKSKLVIRNPYITIAGQTAPGDGIAVRGWTFGCYATHDVIIRYIRIRIGDESGVTMDGAGMGVGTDHSIMDHCSISWTIDESFSSRGGKNITLQRTLIAEALNMSVHSHYVGTGKGHSFAGSISGNVGSFHHNLLANCAGRTWSLAGGLTQGGKFDGFLDIRNNVVYNWQHRTNDGGVKALNLVGNIYIPGPASRVFHLLMPDAGTPKDPQQYYVFGNMMEGRPQYDADNWKNGGVNVAANLISQIKLSKPFCEPYVTTQSPKVAYESVMNDVGANLPKLDAVDTRIIKDVMKRGTTFKGSKTGTPGIIDSQKDVGGFPELKGGPAPADRDHDGMPDAWEKSNGLSADDPADGNKDSAGDGYTNLERYLNSLTQPPH